MQKLCNSKLMLKKLMLERSSPFKEDQKIELFCVSHVLETKSLLQPLFSTCLGFFLRSGATVSNSNLIF